MKLQITPSSVASTLSAVAVIVATNWSEIAPIFTQVKETPFFTTHPHLFSELVTVATIVMLFGRSIIEHQKKPAPNTDGSDYTTATTGTQGGTV